MPAATTKAELLATTETEWDKLSKLLAQFDDVAASHSGPDGSSAIRIVGHRAAWIDLYFSWCEAAADGDTPEMPAPGFKWNQLEALNDQIFQGQQGWSWSKAKGALADGHVQLMNDLQKARDEELYGRPLAPGLKWTRGRYAEAAGSSHYRSAAKVLRNLKRQRQEASPS